MPDDRPKVPYEDDPSDDAGLNGGNYPLDIDPDELVAMLEEGLADIDAGRVVSLEELDRMVEEAFARQDAELAGKR